ncbi:hypothetical protein EZ428_05180 [Pedobacter frigiditerrae]|uniref:Uncharacterized protein n=1 Tax=Pedobacter frigiditerrae TaxID=2530452 RepID=A0A4R0N473_9SPHI|nr:hypothetical protein [Pedobacter frigiditerrae]TCC94173.1 hypothetical protein EZ428_05180 [Pedobacter frigiditerrae]
MTTIQLEKFTETGIIAQEEVVKISNIILNAFSPNHQKKISLTSANKKEQLIDSFSELIEKIMDVSNSRQEKLMLINFLDKLNHQKEVLEILSGERKFNDIKKASERLGKKAQSAFETK